MIKGCIKNTVCRPQDPFVGDITVEKSDLDIRSIELQLMRIEIITGNFFYLVVTKCYPELSYYSTNQRTLIIKI